MTTGEVKEMISKFENGTWPKEKWTHEAHFVMALWYCYYLPFPEAIQRIKEGIKKYNIATGGQNTGDSGYHETITLFYIYSLNHYLVQQCDKHSFDKLLEDLYHQPFLEKEFPLQYYSRARLMSSEARKNWICPDKQSFCFTP